MERVTYCFFHVIGQLPISQETIDSAGMVRPGEVLMLVLALSIVIALLTFISKERRDAGAAMSKKDDTMQTAVTTFAKALERTNDLIVEIQERDHKESTIARREYNAQCMEMLKGTAIVSEMAKDVKDLCKVMLDTTVNHQKMLEDQRSILHDQRNIMQSTKNMSETAQLLLTKLVMKEANPATQHHDHHFPATEPAQDPNTPKNLPMGS